MGLLSVETVLLLAVILVGVGVGAGIYLSYMSAPKTSIQLLSYNVYGDGLLVEVYAHRDYAVLSAVLEYEYAGKKNIVSLELLGSNIIRANTNTQLYFVSPKTIPGNTVLALTLMLRDDSGRTVNQTFYLVRKT